MEEEVTSSERGKKKRPSSAAPPPPAAAAKEEEDLGGGGGSSCSSSRADMEREMEKFYALLDNISAIRDSLRRLRNKRMKTAVAEPAPPAWRPRFELEDFAQDRGAEAADEDAGGANKGERERSRKEEEDDEKN